MHGCSNFLKVEAENKDIFFVYKVVDSCQKRPQKVGVGKSMQGQSIYSQQEY